MTEQLFVEAWQVVGSYGATAAQLLALAQASEQSHPDEALTAYGQEADRLAVLGGQTNYEAASKLIARMKSIREINGQCADHETFLDDFWARHKAKRNLMKLLETDVIDKSRRRAGRVPM
jgi:uncharacterized Zn finger protein